MKNRPLVRSLVILAAVLLAPLLFDGIKELIRWNTTRNYPRLTDSEVRELVQIGMSKDAVHEHLGDPAKKNDGGRIWIYLNRSPNPSDHVSPGYRIQFENDLVARISFGSPKPKE
jgi:outer membrane protein assembly factor BamE (lipoprotein component of BamABCDE complex)